MRTTYGSVVFEHNVPDRDAVCVARLRRAGAIIFGKTTLPEFATKGVVDSPLLGVTRNPWNLDKVVGGSSGGAAAAVAAGLGPLAIGNDQAGSVRIPAALCGVAAIKPTGGRVPFVPNWFPWDTMFSVGMIARDVRDLDLALGVLEGPDAGDPLSLPRIQEDVAQWPAFGSVRVAWSGTLGFGRADEDVLAVVGGVVDRLSSVCRVQERVMDLSPATEAYTRLVPMKRLIEIGDRLDSWQSRMDPAVVAYVRRAQAMSADDVRSALGARLEAYNEVERVFLDWDVIATPTLSVSAFDVGQDRPAQIAGLPLKDFHEWFPFTYPFNMTGHPAVTLPIGFTVGNLPVGLQLVGRRFADHWLLKFASEVMARLGLEPGRPALH
ncbi:Aspartyl-tRNA(Asn)/glutamyl-tRNA(Gln) amidotransferase subunit A OS=Castellaniella defragrans OX=75697 GN=HNR28_003073 PE=3 SV=1 [Castellaniella defragrans]